MGARPLMADQLPLPPALPAAAQAAGRFDAEIVPMPSIMAVAD